VLSPQVGHLGGSTAVEWVSLVMSQLMRVFTHEICGECSDVRSHIRLELTIVLVCFLCYLGGVLDTRKEIYALGW
jgi:hypothetical protein